MKFGLRSPVRRMEYLAQEKIYASELRVFATRIIRFLWNMPSISRDSKNERFATLVLLLFILQQNAFTCGINIPVRHFEKIFYDCEYLQLFTRFPYISL